MYTFTSTQTRPSISIPFYFQSGLFSSKMKEYIKENHPYAILRVDRTLSLDGLTLTQTIECSNRKNWLALLSDSVYYNEARLQQMEYESDNDIKTISITIGSKD